MAVMMGSSFVFLIAAHPEGNRSCLSLFFDQPRDLAPSVFEICFVELDALFERAAFFSSPFPGITLLALPAS